MNKKRFWKLDGLLESFFWLLCVVMSCNLKLYFARKKKSKSFLSSKITQKERILYSMSLPCSGFLKTILRSSSILLHLLSRTLKNVLIPHRADWKCFWEAQSELQFLTNSAAKVRKIKERTMPGLQFLPMEILKWTKTYRFCLAIIDFHKR